MIDRMAEDSYNTRLIRYLVRFGKPLRAVDFYNEVGVDAGLSKNANIKALKRLVKWNVLSFIGERYYISKPYYKSVFSLHRELAGKEKALVR